MRMSHLFSQTLREIPAEAETAGHQLLLRAGYIRQHAAGVFSYLPLARRLLNKIENIMRQEIEAIGGQEISMPLVQPAELWKESGRWYQIDDELGRFVDRSGRDMALAMTHEEAVADLVRRMIRSYRQLPSLIYQIQTKWRDDPRPRAGLIRAREFSMKDSYSLDATWDGLDRQYQAHYEAYFRIFRRCGLEPIAVKADTGMMGGTLAHEFMYLTQIGEDTILICDRCNYTANRQIARFRKTALPAEDLAPLQKVATPECKTIEELAAFLGVPKAKTAKAVFLIVETGPKVDKESKGNQEADKGKQEVFVFTVIRGDMEVNETKLTRALELHGIRAVSLRPAKEEEIRAVGAAPGYASPVGLSLHSHLVDENSDAQGQNLQRLVMVDDLIPVSTNLVAGANETGFHLLNVNYGRDYVADIIADIAAAQDGDACPECGGPMRSVRGVEIGNIFKLGTHYSEAMGCNYVDADGDLRPIVMGSYGIGSGRLMASIAEACHDENGLSWPVNVAPYSVHIVGLIGKGSSETQELAERLYRELWEAGIETLYDDRLESPGVKFNDADLIGLPLRLTVSERGLKGGTVELKHRIRSEREPVVWNEAVQVVEARLNALKTELEAKTLLPVPALEAK